MTDALRGVSHNGFPVVRDSPGGQVFVGLLTRSHIMAVLQRIVVAGVDVHSHLVCTPSLYALASCLIVLMVRSLI